jgi:hypothetical protein
MSSKSFTRQIFSWLRQINIDCELPPNAAKVAITLAADYFNEDQGGMAWAALQTIASDARLAKATVISMVRRLQGRGHLRIEWGKRGSGHSNHYFMVLKTEHGDLFEHAEKRSAAADLSDPNKRSTCGARKGQNRGGKRSTFEEKRSEALDLNRLESPNKRREESKTPASDDASLNFNEPGEPEGQSINPPSPEQAALRLATEERPAQTENPKPPPDRFEEFWSIYPRRVAKGAARKAFASAIRRGIDPDVIIAGVEMYAVTRAGEPQKYTKHPATWLNHECWEDEPPSGAIIDEDGNVIAIDADAGADDFGSHHAEFERLAGGPSW